MTDDDVKREFFERVIGKAQTQREAFTNAVIEQIGAEFSIPTELHDQIGLFLEVGANAFYFEARRAGLDFDRARQELRSLERSARATESALQNLFADTQDVLAQAGIARGLNGFHVPRVSQHEGVQVLNYAVAGDEETRQISLSEVEAILAALGNCAVDAKPLARASRMGRPEHEALYDLFIFAHLVWDTLLHRAFKLDWATNGDPITDAARFSVRIAHIVEPSLTLKQIATSARKVREKSISFRNLEEVPKVIEHYRKQFE